MGFRAVFANDHLVFSRPWLDGPTALATVLAKTGSMGLGTSVSLPVVRGPVPLAKTLGSLDHLSQGRLSVGVGPGSSPRDYAAVGVPFGERWKRLEESIAVLRALWRRDGSGGFNGQFYSTEGVQLEPYPHQQPGPPIWLGSRGSEAGLRRTARLADGWQASAYNTTPSDFAKAYQRLQHHLVQAGKDPGVFPNAIATMFFFVTEDRSKADRILSQMIAPTLNRPTEELKDRLLVGPAQECAEKLASYREVGVQRMLLWPVADEVRQLSTFQEQVAGQVAV